MHDILPNVMYGIMFDTIIEVMQIVMQTTTTGCHA